MFDAVGMRSTFPHDAARAAEGHNSMVAAKSPIRKGRWGIRPPNPLKEVLFKPWNLPIDSFGSAKLS
jgi:hypothetical protein